MRGVSWSMKSEREPAAPNPLRAPLSEARRRRGHARTPLHLPEMQSKSAAIKKVTGHFLCFGRTL